ncbi:Mu-like prophage DNA circulation protein [Pseudoxanthobacter soli DSM 19599]|uniref:Mu-like prophage DNA circulation protein n=1 Tax=Pseudoxanthobacter soli DSM 19599 TaxID=1123029 RepID=A0A1M7ZLY1_9HYPH|nr:DNA circularization N-terminal domain-containing protein [Pseudoxanthobacter soli]SHO65812.1 Mu-like prophage DNA circulation protein [Pseudoxanthobacter soli DSM 19599]
MDPEIQLWPSVFNGVPFWCDSEGMETGRRLAIYEFPGRDVGFVEDLGARQPRFRVTGYLSGLGAEGASTGLISLFAGVGPAILLLPAAGPVSVYCERAVRNRSLDRIGWAAFELDFVLGGAAFALASVLSLGQLVFDAAGGIISGIASLAGRFVAPGGWVDPVAAAAAGGLQDTVATLEAIRTEAAIDETASAALRDTLAGLYGAMPGAVGGAAAIAAVPVDAVVAATLAPTDTIPALAVAAAEALAPFAGMLAAARALGDAMAPADAAAAFAAALDGVSDPAAADVLAAPSVAAIAANDALVAGLSRLTYLAPYAEALARMSYPDRRAGVTARADFAERCEPALASATGAAGMEVFATVSALRGSVAAYLSRTITDLAPVVTVSAPRSMPAIWWAWRLYGDPERAGELVERNSVRHPAFMPASFEALAR